LVCKHAFQPVAESMENIEVLNLTRAQRLIRAQTDFISRVIDASPDIINITNIHSGTRVYLNKVLLIELGYTREDIRVNALEQNFESLYHPEDQDALQKFKAAIARAADEEIVETESRLKAKTGNWQWIRMRAKVFQRNENSEVEKYIAFSQNITADKNLEREKKQNNLLLELNRSKTDFFSNASHEFRTPLSLLMGPLQDVLSTSQNLSASQVAKLQMAYRNALRLQKLVNTQLDYARIEAGRMEAVFQPTDIARLTEDIASNFRSLIESAGLKYVVKCKDSGEPVYVSRDLWEKIVSNLISNAFKFTFEGKIEVVIRSNKKHIQLHVRDSGIGISKADTTKIFERFTRIENVKSRSYAGTGIGLTLVRELVHLHGGNIKVKSAPGVGATFVVIIPRGKSHLPAKQIYEFREGYEADSYVTSFVEEAHGWAGASDQSSHNKQVWTPKAVGKTILIVDDHVDMLAYLLELFAGHYEVVLAENGAKAMEKINNGLKPDLILCDVMMPETDGIELLRALKTNPATAHISIILLSARASEDSKIQALELGAADYITKPFSANELLSRVDAHLKLQKKRTL
jgi:PAS domain S-box-containing protein